MQTVPESPSSEEEISEIRKLITSLAKLFSQHDISINTISENEADEIMNAVNRVNHLIVSNNRSNQSYNRGESSTRCSLLKVTEKKAYSGISKLIFKEFRPCRVLKKTTKNMAMIYQSVNDYEKEHFLDKRTWVIGNSVIKPLTENQKLLAAFLINIAISGWLHEKLITMEDAARGALSAIDGYIETSAYKTRVFTDKYENGKLINLTMQMLAMMSMSLKVFSDRAVLTSVIVEEGRIAKIIDKTMKKNRNDFEGACELYLFNPDFRDTVCSFDI